MPIFRRSRFWILLAVVLAGFCGASTFALLEMRRDSYEIATANARNLLAVVSQDIENNLLAYDRVLIGVVGKLGDAGLARLDERMQQAYLFDRALFEPYFTSLLVLDADGNVVRDAGALPHRSDNFSDRSYFKAQRDGAVDGLYVSDPFRRRLTGADAVIALSRKVLAADGSFAGVVVGTVRLDYFKSLFERAALHPRDSVNLFSAGGTMVMRTPYREDQIGRDLSSSANVRRFIAEGAGTFSGVAAVDGVRRVYTFGRIGSLPLIMNVALDEDAIYAGWRVRAAQIATALGLLCVVALVLGILVRRELTRRARAEARALENETQYRLLADNATDIILRLDRDLTRQYVSPACRRVLGYEPDELVGRKTRELIHPDDWPIVERIVVASRAAAEPVEASYRLRHRTGRDVWVEGRYGYLPKEDGYLVVLRDVSKRKVAEAELETVHARLEQLANKDGLTGLSNRREFDESLAREWNAAAESEEPLSLLLLDVDQFKRFNDVQGHQAGDECLRRVSDAIAGCGRLEDVVARYGGEEFAVILPGLGEGAARLVAQRIVQAVEDLGIEHSGNPSGVVTISIGLSTIGSAASVEIGMAEMIRHADAALYEAKRTGRNRVVVASEMPKDPRAPVRADEEERSAVADSAARARGSMKIAALDAIARSAAEVMNAPIGFVSLVGSDTVVLAGRHHIDVESVPRDVAFCSHTVTGIEPLVVTDLASDPRFSRNPLVAGDGGLRFYMGAPFLDPSTGQPVGAVCVASFESMHTEPTSEQKRSLMAMGRAAATCL